MLSVYRVFRDVNHFQHLLATDPQFAERLPRDGRSFRDVWRPPEVYRRAPKLMAPDFWDLVPLRGLALTRDLYMSLPMLHDAGELLPLSFKDKQLNLDFFNLTNVVDCLDKKKSDFRLALDPCPHPQKGHGETICPVAMEDRLAAATLIGLLENGDGRNVGEGLTTLDRQSGLTSGADARGAFETAFVTEGLGEHDAAATCIADHSGKAEHLGVHGTDVITFVEPCRRVAASQGAEFFDRILVGLLLLGDDVEDLGFDGLGDLKRADRSDGVAVTAGVIEDINQVFHDVTCLGTRHHECHDCQVVGAFEGTSIHGGHEVGERRHPAGWRCWRRGGGPIDEQAVLDAGFAHGGPKEAENTHGEVLSGGSKGMKNFRHPRSGNRRKFSSRPFVMLTETATEHQLGLPWRERIDRAGERGNRVTPVLE